MKEKKYENIMKELQEIRKILDQQKQTNYDTLNRCSKCGMVFDVTTGYVCMQLDCPMFYRANFYTSSTTGEQK